MPTITGRICTPVKNPVGSMRGGAVPVSFGLCCIAEREVTPEFKVDLQLSDSFLQDRLCSHRRKYSSPTFRPSGVIARRGFLVAFFACFPFLQHTVGFPSAIPSRQRLLPGSKKTASINEPAQRCTPLCALYEFARRSNTLGNGCNRPSLVAASKASNFNQG